MPQKNLQHVSQFALPLIVNQHKVKDCAGPSFHRALQGCVCYESVLKPALAWRLHGKAQGAKFLLSSKPTVAHCL